MKKKIILVVGALVMILGIATCETYAVFQADGNDVQTHITTNRLDIELVGSGTEIQEVVDLVPNQTINKEMAVTNTKDTTLYTRVTLRKYWVDKDGKKDFTQDASEIELDYNQENWLVEYADDEDVVLYYRLPLAPQETTENFLESIKVPKDFNNKDMGRKFVLDVQVDAVQSIDASNAILTQWGVLPTFENEELTKIER